MLPTLFSIGAAGAMNIMLEERLLQCCVHIGTAGGSQHQCAPFLRSAGVAAAVEDQTFGAYGKELPLARAP
ncbi:MAG TPA: hypothetical protein VEU28_05055 [Actinomycetota bacterium]|nr:hypothetical protein [Actinomycetota bacterium]